MADQSPDGGMPRWVKLLLLAGAVLVVLVAAGLLLFGGEHDPSRHMQPGVGTPAIVAVADPAAPRDDYR